MKLRTTKLEPSDIGKLISKYEPDKHCVFVSVGKEKLDDAKTILKKYNINQHEEQFDMYGLTLEQYDNEVEAKKRVKEFYDANEFLYVHYCKNGDFISDNYSK